jgi:hypothetical protein
VVGPRRRSCRRVVVPLTWPVVVACHRCCRVVCVAGVCRRCRRRVVSLSVGESGEVGWDWIGRLTNDERRIRRIRRSSFVCHVTDVAPECGDSGE